MQRPESEGGRVVPDIRPTCGNSMGGNVKAAQAKVSALEKSVADLQSQIAMKNKAIAELEAKLAKSK